ncbi:MAG: isoprenylcysteine carboxylmethyltransferase family protein [Candidatus Omnitrophota bacterium]
MCTCLPVLPLLTAPVKKAARIKFSKNRLNTHRPALIDPARVRPQYIAYTLLFTAILLHFMTKPAYYVTPPFNYIGLFFIVDGCSLIYWARKLFISSATPVSCAEQPVKIIQEGIYKTIRHPMYVGGVIVCAGIGILIGTWPFFLVPVTLLLIFDRVYVSREEQIMEDLFGEDYVLYKKSTRRWLYRII